MKIGFKKRAICWRWWGSRNELASISDLPNRLEASVYPVALLGVSTVRMLDLFCGRWGWSKAFAARGWECVGVDLIAPPEVPKGCEFIMADILECETSIDGKFWYGNYSTLRPDFICASSPCEQFSVHGMKHFHPNPPYPELGIKLFEHTRRICEESGVPYVMEQVRAAQQFVGNAVHHCGPFYLWGTGVPPLTHKGITKGTDHGWDLATRKRSAGHLAIVNQRRPVKGAKHIDPTTAIFSTIPPELANCVADYAERILEVRV